MHRLRGRRRATGVLLVCALAALAGCGGSGETTVAGGGDPSVSAGAGSPIAPAGAPAAAPAPAPAPGPAAAAAPTPAQVKTVAVASGLVSPWGLAFLPDGRMLVTEKEGRLRYVSATGQVSAPLTGVPAVSANGQGGLLDVVLSPGFATDSTVYFSFAEPVAGGLARTAVARARLGTTSISDVTVIFRQSPATAAGNHFGSRLAFAPSGHLFVTLGERTDRDRAQELGNHLGKVVRLNADGSVPPDNPFVGTIGALPEIWSYGHRNPQGAAIEPATGRLWTTEHGAQGGDEVNVPARGGNHGWPRITYSVEYGSGAPIGEGTSKPGIEPPLHYWVPVSIAPSGMAFYTGSAVPAWRGHLFVGALAGQALIRLTVSGTAVTAEERLLTSIGDRIRDVRMGPDGHLYVLTDSTNGRILRVQVE